MDPSKSLLKDPCPFGLPGILAVAQMALGPLVQHPKPYISLNPNAWQHPPTTLQDTPNTI